ncbi:hypothetical protein NPIL_371651 [Nephila pilipes]|uniref:Uncharacterized protein n=1 Tax=Nephila pilipes TaxID=299642 RepID=A0A8X6N965_NEPPI|nr:hypothetical protein NPIL_371651 [Nephila pilipes]
MMCSTGPSTDDTLKACHGSSTKQSAESPALKSLAKRRSDLRLGVGYAPRSLSNDFSSPNVCIKNLFAWISSDVALNLNKIQQSASFSCKHGTILFMLQKP